jgi:predicted component of type VI protein secretion system
MKLSQITSGNLPQLEGAITVNIETDPELNWFDKRSHGLAVALVQATSPGILTALSKSPTGPQKILEGTVSDPAIVTVDIINVQPGSTTAKVISRAEMGKYIAIVAGYYDLDPEKSMLVIRTPIYVDRTYHLDPIALFHTDTPMYAPFMRIDLKLGSMRILPETTFNVFWLKPEDGSLIGAISGMMGAVGGTISGLFK